VGSPALVIKSFKFCYPLVYRVLLSFLIQGRNLSSPSAIAFSIGPKADVETKRELVRRIT